MSLHLNETCIIVFFLARSLIYTFIPFTFQQYEYISRDEVFKIVAQWS